MQRLWNSMILVALVGSLFGTAVGLWLAGPRRKRGFLTGEWLAR